MKAPQRRMVTATVAILIVVITGLVVRNCGTAGPEQIAIKTGQTKPFGSITWSVISVTKTATINQSGADLSAKGIFLVIDLNLTNEGKEKIQFDPRSIVVTDDAGKTYAPNEKATAAQINAQMKSDVGSIFNTALDLNKKQRLSGTFDIDKTATKLQLIVLGEKYSLKQDLAVELGF